VNQTSADYILVWPRHLFQREASTLINSMSKLKDWDSQCELLLEDAFAGVAPRDDLKEQSDYGNDSRDFMVALLRRAPHLKEAAGRTPYWSERRHGGTPGALSLTGTVREFIRVIGDFETRGYFENVFDKDCVDSPAQVDPSAYLEREIGVPNVWPLRETSLSGDQDLFFDVIEVLHDQVARPRSRWLHPYAGCGWHYSSFSLDTGRQLYRWRVNKLLDRSDLGLRLAEGGEDQGRLVAATDQARTDLATAMASRSDPGTGDLVRHALALYRARNASEHDKRSAAVALAGVLEERRGLLKSELVSKDEGALFQIANQFAIRHRNDHQNADYDPVFLDWVFWWYLATIELTDRLLARQSNVSVSRPQPF